MLSFPSLGSSFLIDNYTDYWLLTVKISILLSATEMQKKRSILSPFFNTPVQLLEHWFTFQIAGWISKWTELRKIWFLFIFWPNTIHTSTTVFQVREISPEMLLTGLMRWDWPLPVQPLLFCAAFQENNHQMAAAHKPQILLPKAIKKQSF